MAAAEEICDEEDVMLKDLIGTASNPQPAAAASDASTTFSLPADDPHWKLIDNVDWEQICVDLADPLWKVEWQPAAIFRPIVTTACQAPPGFKCTEFDIVKYNLDGVEDYRRTGRSGLETFSVTAEQWCLCMPCTWRVPALNATAQQLAAIWMCCRAT